MTTDRTQWPKGPWDDEPDHVVWIDETTGLDCMINRGPLGALCGYVAVTEGHPLYGVDWDDFPLRVEVHGGVTYANECQGDICHVPAEGRPDDVWWIGFDCGHAWDVTPGIEFTHHQGEDGSMFRTTYKNIDYVRAECENLAKQLKLMQLVCDGDELPHWITKLSDGAWSITDKGIDDE